MPERFRKIGLPSFWMPYVAVDSAEAACEQARHAGGKVEVGPVAFSDAATIALIRDPLGAGFTVYEGTGLTPCSADAGPGHRIWNALYVSDTEAVKGFYEAVFAWRISREPTRSGAYRVRNARGETIADIQEPDDATRGPFQFRGVHFAVPDVADAKTAIERNGGDIVHEDHDATGPTILAKDPDGTAFFIREAEAPKREAPADRRSARAGPTWKTIVGLPIVCVAVLFEQNWVWGLLFILWTVPAIRSGETVFVEPISRRANPVPFGLIVATWIGLSVYLVVADLSGVPTPTASN